MRCSMLGEANKQNLNLSLLEDTDTLVYGAPEVDMPFELIGSEMEDFEISGSISLSGVAYDNDAILTILRTEIVSVETPGKQLIRIDEDSMNINVLEHRPVARPRASRRSRLAS